MTSDCKGVGLVQVLRGRNVNGYARACSKRVVFNMQIGETGDWPAWETEYNSNSVLYGIHVRSVPSYGIYSMYEIYMQVCMGNYSQNQSL